MGRLNSEVLENRLALKCPGLYFVWLRPIVLFSFPLEEKKNQSRSKADISLAGWSRVALNYPRGDVSRGPIHGSALPGGPNPAALANSWQKRPARPQPLTAALETRRALFNKLVNSNLVLKMSLRWKHSSLGKMETQGRR